LVEVDGGDLLGVLDFVDGELGLPCLLEVFYLNEIALDVDVVLWLSFLHLLIGRVSLDDTDVVLKH